VNAETRRILLATALSAGIMFAFVYLQGKAGPKERPREGPVEKEAPVEGARERPRPVSPPLGEEAGAKGPEETAVVETDQFRMTLSSVGGSVKSVELKGPKFQRQGKEGAPGAVELVHVDADEPWPGSLAASRELGGSGALAEDSTARSTMRIVARDKKSVTFAGRVGTAQVRKRFFVEDRPYEIGLEVKVAAERKGELALLFPGFVPASAPKPGLLSGGQVSETVTPVCRAGGETARFGGKQMEEVVPGTVAWMGLDQHYFLSALMPESGSGECVFFRGARSGESGAALRLPVDRELTVAFRMFMGPKQLDLLRAAGRELDSAVDYGSITKYFAFFARVLLYVMRALEAVVKNWGIAIILLTVLVKAILYPLTAKSMQSMNEMRKLQPEIEKLKAKHGDDKEKLNMAVMQLYQQHKVNPLGGCLPMLIQMPIWFALYATLQTSVELYRERFLWLHDLTQFDPFYILPLAMGASSFAMQRLSPQPADNTQAKMLLYFMPAFFTFIMLRLPSGLTLYILVNNVLSILQQQWLMRRQARA